MSIKDFTSQTEVLILVGGRGTRLSSVVSDLPKPMAPVMNKAFVEYIIDFIKKSGFYNIALLTGYKSEAFNTLISQDKFSNLNIRVSHESNPLGTGGAIKQAMETSSFGKFLIINGDSIIKLDLLTFLQQSLGKTLTVASCFVKDISRYGEVVIDKEGWIKSFLEKTGRAKSGVINSGVYFAQSQLLTLMPAKKSFSFEKECLERLSLEKKVFSLVYNVPFLDIGIPEDYYRAADFLKEHFPETVD